MKKWMIGLLLLNLAPLCHAHSVDLFLTGGAGISQINNKTAVNINNVIVNNYITNTSTQTQPFYGAGIGYTFSQVANKPVDIALDLAGYYHYFGTIDGTEYPFANAGDFDTLNYAFKARSYALLVEPRFIYSQFSWQPYALFGLGSAWNHLYSYSETPTDPAGSASPVPIAYYNRTLTTLAYEVGIGIQKQFFMDTHGCRYFAALDYRYLDDGKGELGNFPAKTAAGTFHVTNLAAQVIALNLKISF